MLPLVGKLRESPDEGEVPLKEGDVAQLTICDGLDQVALDPWLSLQIPDRAKLARSLRQGGDQRYLDIGYSDAAARRRSLSQ